MNLKQIQELCEYLIDRFPPQEAARRKAEVVLADVHEFQKKVEEAIMRKPDFGFSFGFDKPQGISEQTVKGTPRISGIYVTIPAEQEGETK